MRRRTVQDVMTTNVVTVSERTPFAEIAEVLARHNVSGVPVVNGDGRVAGMVTEADLLRKQEYKDNGDGHRSLRARLRRNAQAEAKAAAVDARGLMTAPVVSVAPDTPLDEAARLLNSHGFKAMPVIGGDGRLAGIVARRDLLSVFHRPDAEIRDEVMEDVIIRKLWHDPAVLHARVQNGVVHLTGRVEVKSLVPVVVRMVRRIEGVVDVVHHLGYDHDDTRAGRYTTV